MNMKERLLEFIRYTGLPVYQFEKLCGLSNAYIKNMSKGIGADKLERILSKFPELSKQWLLYGEGNMLVEPSMPGTEINIDNTNMGHHNNIGHHNSVNISGIPAGGDAETWKKIAESHEQQIADLKQQIADLKADKEKLYQLLMKK